MFKLKTPKLIKNLFNYETRMRMRQKEADFYWYVSGMPDPPVYSYKRKMIRKLAKQTPAKVFIETGTFSGDTVEAIRTKFDKIYSIELDKTLYEKAKKRFEGLANVKILHGDSASVLPEILKEFPGPAVFWLDGHYSGEGTAKAGVETPIFQELKAIFSHPNKNHLILIDDARCFDGTHDYPTLEALKNFIKGSNPSLGFEIKHDVIIVKPNR